MGSAQQPSNRALQQLITKGFADVKDVQQQQQADINQLLDWKKGTEIAKNAVAEYKRDEEQSKESRQKRELLKQGGIVLGLVTTVIYVYLSTKGIHP